MSPRRRFVRLACALPLLVRLTTGAATDSPPPGNIWPAHPAALFDPASRCPQLQPASPEDAAGALVVFEVSPSGHPSHAAVKSSSSDEKLDAAAVSCVMKLRFQPPTLLGEGTPIAAWEQIAFKWAPPPARRTEAAAVAGAATGAGAVTGAAAAGTAVAGIGATSATGAGVGTRSAELRVCVDATGKLVQAPTLVRSSGDAAFDAAALSVARAGSGSYRAANADGRAVSGCVDLALTTEQR
jgi:TonB family protein